MFLIIPGFLFNLIFYTCPLKKRSVFTGLEHKDGGRLQRDELAGQEIKKSHECQNDSNSL